MIIYGWHANVLGAPIRTPLLVKLGNGEVFHAHFIKPDGEEWTWETLSGDHRTRGLNPTHWSWLPPDEKP